jgi:hypothetical protein
MGADNAVIAVLTGKGTSAVKVTLLDGRMFTVFNVAWGYDDGDTAAHVTTNISPSVDGTTIDVFLTTDVREIEDLGSKQILYQAAFFGQ